MIWRKISIAINENNFGDFQQWISWKLNQKKKKLVFFLEFSSFFKYFILHSSHSEFLWRKFNNLFLIMNTSKSRPIKSSPGSKNSRKNALKNCFKYFSEYCGGFWFLHFLDVFVAIERAGSRLPNLVQIKFWI